MIRRFAQLGALALALVLPHAAGAEDLPPNAGAERTVKMFDLFCLSQLPNLEAITKLAEAGEFKALKGEELKKYQPQIKAEEIYAWRYKDFDSDFILTASRTQPDAQFKKDVPEFADSTNFGCSLVIPTNDAKEDLLAEMSKVMDRKPDESWDQAPLKAHSWGGKTDKMLVYIYYYAPLKAPKGGLLSAVVSLKNE